MTKEEQKKLKSTARGKAWRLANPERYKEHTRNSNLKNDYGISLLEYKELEQKQGGVCFVCKSGYSRALSVDHCHTTGKVRSLLCNPCNAALGLLKEDPERMRALACYIESHNENIECEAKGEVAATKSAGPDSENVSTTGE